MPGKVKVSDWGLLDYKEAWDRQEALFKAMVDAKFAERELDPEQKTPLLNHLIFVEHPHVYTLGKSGDPANLLLDEQGLKQAEASYYPINRGGDITYHGPGQIVVYPIFDLEQFFTDIHRYLRTLEGAVIETLASYGIESGRYEGYTGVWLDADNEKARKICAMGVRCSRWVTMHGIAFNVNTDLAYFKNIIPCGIDDKDVTSMQRELGAPQHYEKVKKVLMEKILKAFEITKIEA
ncbi:MAG: lipoyl(octanoyl) transferase LipB [Bacteroidetes bacterium]|nr:lipoyl(octanoyl) transferase LipB [Bacteroidota bacterium]